MTHKYNIVGESPRRVPVETLVFSGNLFFRRSANICHRNNHEKGQTCLANRMEYSTTHHRLLGKSFHNVYFFQQILWGILWYHVKCHDFPHICLHLRDLYHGTTYYFAMQNQATLAWYLHTSIILLLVSKYLYTRCRHMSINWGIQHLLSLVESMGIS
jgi:hypothetical protein